MPYFKVVGDKIAIAATSHEGKNVAALAASLAKLQTEVRFVFETNFVNFLTHFQLDRKFSLSIGFLSGIITTIFFFSIGDKILTKVENWKKIPQQLSLYFLIMLKRKNLFQFLGGSDRHCISLQKQEESVRQQNRSCAWIKIHATNICRF